MHRLQPILETALGEQLVLPERQLSSIDDFVVRFREVKRVRRC